MPRFVSLRSFALALALLGTSGGVAVAQPAEDGLEREFPFLPDESHEGTRSVGDASHGHLVAGRRIEESERLGILPKQRERGLRYGTDELVGLLDDASRALHAATGTRLWLGNVSRRGGGDIVWSVSHNSGRDADVAFAYVDGSGRPVDPPDLVRLQGAGTASELGLAFDVRRTWIVVKALLTSPRASVQFLFISAPLESQLIAHARRLGEPPELVQKAIDALRQPGGAAPHDDHLHVRIYCSERDVLAGCIDAGVEHPWYRSAADARERRIREVTAFLASPEPSVRASAIDRLVLLGVATEHDRYVAALDDPNPQVRRAAVDALAVFGSGTDVHALARLYRKDPVVEVRLAVLRAVPLLGGAEAGGLLAEAVVAPADGASELERAFAAYRALEVPAAALLAPRLLGWTAAPPTSSLVTLALEDLLAPTLPVDDGWLNSLASGAQLAKALHLSAIDAAARAERLEPVAPLAALVRASDPSVRAAADRALSFAVNLPRRCEESDDDGTCARAASRWEQLVVGAAPSSRDAWLLAGFRNAGFDVPDLQPRRGWDLLKAVGASDHLSFNAQRLLMRIFDYRPPSLAWSKKDACTHWLRWLDGNRKRHDLPAPDASVRGACWSVRD